MLTNSVYVNRFVGWWWWW